MKNELEKELFDKMTPFLKEYLNKHDEIDFMVAIFNHKTNILTTFGRGCKACIAAEIVEIYEKGELKHISQISDNPPTNKVH